MSTSKMLFLGSIGMLIMPQMVSANFFDTVMDKVERSVDQRVKKRTNKTVEDSLDSVEKGIDDTLKGKNKEVKSTDTSSDESVDNSSQGSNVAVSSPKVSWSRFDFVPGDTVIFEDAPSADEENGEFPSRWDLFQGGAEIAEVDGTQAITFITDSGNMYRKGIVPYLKNSKEDYLPDVFTIEFDAYYMPNQYNQSYYITLWDKKNQRSIRNSLSSQLQIGVNEIEIGSSSATLAGKRGNRDAVGGWRHISIAYTKGKFKAYLQDQRLINIPHLEGNPVGITLSATGKTNFVKNFRIAKGGVKYYDRVLSDGKIIVNGIRFDVNKATLKPQSSGAINKIYKLMKKHPEIKFRVEGHTDSDGDAANNLILSQKRSEAVMQRLISMGISADRLQAKGKGETTPIDNNGTPEGKANNRRVEFIKL